MMVKVIMVESDSCSGGGLLWGRISSASVEDERCCGGG